MTGIGVLAEGPLHADLKRALARPGDRLEVAVDRFWIDIVRADGELVEIQTGGFAPLAPKLDALLDRHRVRIIHPVAAHRRIVRVDEDGVVVTRRASPRRATALDVFDRLVAFPTLLRHPNLCLEVLMTEEDHVRGPAPVTVRGRRRDPGQRRLVAIGDRVVLRGPADALALVPLPAQSPFGTRELAHQAGCGLVLAQRVIFCLRALELLEAAGRRGRAPVYRVGAAPGVPSTRWRPRRPHPGATTV